MTASYLCRNLWLHLKPLLKLHKTMTPVGLNTRNLKKPKQCPGKRIVFFEMP